MVLHMPRASWSIRNVLLLLFMTVGGVSGLAGVYRGERPSADDWAALGLGLGAIVAPSSNHAEPPDKGGSADAGTQSRFRARRGGSAALSHREWP
jgi:hypothetical protein